YRVTLHDSLYSLTAIFIYCFSATFHIFSLSLHDALPILLSISAEQDMTELYSAIMPYGSEVEREDGSKRPLTIKDVSWSTSSYPVNKPLGDEILELKNVTDRIGYVDSNGNTKPRIAIMNFDTDNAMTLMNLAYSWLIENSLPKIVFNLEVFDGDNLQLGDEVMIAYNNIGLVKPTRP